MVRKNEGIRLINGGYCLPYVDDNSTTRLSGFRSELSRADSEPELHGHSRYQREAGILSTLP